MKRGIIKAWIFYQHFIALFLISYSCSCRFSFSISSPRFYFEILVRNLVVYVPSPTVSWLRSGSKSSVSIPFATSLNLSALLILDFCLWFSLFDTSMSCSRSQKLSWRNNIGWFSSYCDDPYVISHVISLREVVCSSVEDDTVWKAA